MQVIKRISAGLLALAFLSTVSFAGPKQPTCSACKMSLSSKKDKVHTVAVKIKGKTYYCCAGCAMNKKPAKGKKKN